MKNIVIENYDGYTNSNRNGVYGGLSGGKEGILIDGEYWIIKYPKSTKSLIGSNTDLGEYTTSPLSEFIGSHIYDILGYDVHETRLGYRDEKLVVACKDFCESNEYILKEIRTIKNVHNKKLEEILEKSLSSTSTLHHTDINELLLHIKYNPILSAVSGVEERFWDMIIIDAFINNNDRNNGNWGLLQKGNCYTIAPIYDNGEAFYNKLSESKIKRILSDEHSLNSNALNGITIYSDGDGSPLTFKKIGEKYITDTKFCNALQKNIKRIEDNMGEIKAFIQEIPEEYKNQRVCSKERKELYILGLELRLEKMFRPFYERIEKLHSEI